MRYAVGATVALGIALGLATYAFAEQVPAACVAPTGEAYSAEYAEAWHHWHVEFCADHD